jgi:glycosyltransferase involved in cell wall biosynthesis
VHCGPYRRDELPGLIGEIDWVVMPSIWYENAPLVIQEAFQHLRPVIASNLGGMAEMVRVGVDGLHARAGDAGHLARVMARAASEDGLWHRLVEGIEPQPTIDECAKAHLSLFDQLKLAEAA